MIDWSVVTLLLGAGALGLAGFHLRTSARRITSVDELETRVRKLEALLPRGDAELAMPRGLPGRVR